MFDLDVILAAHGAGDGSAANSRVLACARALEQSLVGARVTAAFNIGEPTHYAALVSATRARQVVIPLLTSDGYYAARLRRDAVRTFRGGDEAELLPPLGQDQLIIDAISAQAVQQIEARQLDRASCAIVVIGHGTTRHSGSGLATNAVGDSISSVTGIRAHVAFLDAQPTIEQMITSIPSASVLVVVPFLFGGGDHAERDVPAQVNIVNERRQIPFGRTVTLEPMGGLPVIAEVLERLVLNTRRERNVLKVGARPSLLSRQQVELVAARLAGKGVDVRFVAIETQGDRHLSQSISALGADDCFAGDITMALQRDDIDVAVHSAKDLPLNAIDRVVDAAVLPRGAAEEVLVSRSGAPLKELPLGARIGTSCARRSSQLHRIRPDCEVANIRGTVPDRVAAVDRGDFDAVVLAAAGLERLRLSHRIAQRFSLLEFYPAPAQGAVVVQCRDDSPYRALLESINDDNTNAAIRAELSFARAVVSRSQLVPAAHAVADAQGILLRARVIDIARNQVWDTALHGNDPEHVGNEVARWLLEVGNNGAGQAATS